MAAIMPDAIKSLDAYITAPYGLVGVPCGIPAMDKLTSGFRPGELWIVAARPGRGKSVLCGQTAVYAASRSNEVLMFSCEMQPSQVVQRMVLAEADVDRWSLRKGDDGGRWARVAEASSRLSPIPLWFDDSESPTVAQVRAAAERHKAARGSLDLVVVDYLQRLAVDTKQDRWIAVGDLAKGLKTMARALDVPVLAACQVNAESEEKRPTMANLGQSAGIISAEADGIAFLHPRDLNQWKDRQHDYPVLDLHVDKHRNGPLATIGLSFERRTTRFVELAE
jgi:replicative DNA helicase